MVKQPLEAMDSIPENEQVQNNDAFADDESSAVDGDNSQVCEIRVELFFINLSNLHIAQYDAGRVVLIYIGITAMSALKM